MYRAWLLLPLLLGVACSSTDEDPQPRPQYHGLASRPRPALAPVEPPAEAGELQVHVIDVGHGDAILICCPDGEHQMLIDAGERNERFRGSEGKFKRTMIERQPREDALEVVISTHPDSDAVGSLAWVLDEYTVDYLVDNGCTSRYRAWERSHERLAAGATAHYLNLLEQTDPVIDVDFCPRTDVGAVALRPAEFGASKWLDDNSIVVRVTFGERSFLFMGDAEEGTEARLLRDPQFAALIDADFLKVGRHGATTVATEAFLEAVSPDVAAISCGTGMGVNKYLGEPRLKTIQRLEGHVRQRPEGPVLLRVCDGEATRPQEEARKPNETGIFLFTQDPGEFIDYKTSAAIYMTTYDGDLEFLSDGQRIWRRELGEPQDSPSDQ